MFYALATAEGLSSARSSVRLSGPSRARSIRFCTARWWSRENKCAYERSTRSPRRASSRASRRNGRVVCNDEWGCGVQSSRRRDVIDTDVWPTDMAVVRSTGVGEIATISSVPPAQADQVAWHGTRSFGTTFVQIGTPTHAWQQCQSKSGFPFRIMPSFGSDSLGIPQGSLQFALISPRFSGWSLAISRPGKCPQTPSAAGLLGGKLGSLVRWVDS